ncbi:O-antigen translocase [Sediminibacter sp. Hel_I_10]|uniref:O-antigen translocase n=1 Tax=Sediminibacter sp. Hel_I_10 TaxID=1392490 RepID=UPI00047A4D55|nr:O-antigen translocase [Sediminibacter sp. Hel_I_10]
MNFFKTSILSGFNTVITMALGLITNKFIAVFIGSEGFAIIGQLKDFLKIGLSLGQLGFDRGIVKYTSAHKNSSERLSKYLSTIFISQLVISGCIALLIILFHNKLLNYLTGLENYSMYFILIGLSIVPMVLYTSGMSALNGLHEIKKFTLISVIANVIGSGLALILIYKYQLKGVLINLAVIQFINFFVFIVLTIGKPFQRNWFQHKFQKKEFKNLARFSLMSIVGTLVLSLTLIAIRKYISFYLGLDYTGYWEALWRLSVIFVTVLTSAFGFYLLPTFSKLYTKHLKKEIFNIWKITVPVSIFAGIALIIFREFVINLIYSKEFLIISGVLIFQVIGDIIKINSWILGNIILAKVQVKTFIAVQIGWSIAFFTLSIILTQKVGFVGIGMAYLISYILHFLFMNIYFKKLLWRKSISV